ncbi:hypothetical protein LTR37_001847 [Vermiconidia calcicola]|uniref:Uncharacterized protein n=1 Tax=Vermiconidia calcicola TaxID=1690605 RepID=A0ACC3NUB9_9PEZI|nr:hypothetical protein LTR37_001847 [Vermiconidia calcicola]
MEDIVSLEYDCFPPFVREAFMGCNSKDHLPRILEKYKQQMCTDKIDTWIKVVDKESGAVVAASNWKVYVNGTTDGGSEDEVPEWLEGEMREKSEELTRKMNEYRRRAMPGPFVHLHICFTNSDYRRRGAGGMMLKWGCDLADLLGLPGWIEASEEGNFVYKMFGFYDYEKIEGELGGTNMKRDARTAAFEGGKAKA